MSMSRTFGVGPSVTLPIFQGGRLRANLKGKYAQYDIAAASYNQTLVDALRETADTGLPLVEVNPDDPAAQAVRTAARGLLALFPAPLPVLGMAASSGTSQEAEVSGFQLPMVHA